MATRIIEYSGPVRMDGFNSVPAWSQVAKQSPITATTTPASSSAFAMHSNMVCINSDEAVYVAFGTSPTATISDFRVPVNGTQFFDIQPGASWKVSVRT